MNQRKGIFKYTRVQSKIDNRYILNIRERTSLQIHCYQYLLTYKAKQNEIEMKSIKKSKNQSYIMLKIYKQRNKDAKN